MDRDKSIYIVSPEYGIIEGEFLREINGKFEVLLNCPNGLVKLELPKNSIYLTLEEAREKFASLHHWLNRKRLDQAVKGNINFLPEHIGELKGVYHSGNPLRFGEPKISFALQGNVAGKNDNPQKVIQMIGASWEDIEMLLDILYILSFGNEYVKKLIGKYIIIELRSLSACFKRLSELDGNYKENLYPEFINEIKKLEKEVKFGVIKTKRSNPTVRNKISAHRDLNLDLMTSMDLWEKITRNNIYRYQEIFSDHINKFMKMYPHEAKMYFIMRRTPYRSITDVKPPKGNTYKPFDEKIVPRDDVEINK